MEQNALTKNLIAWSAIATIAAGVIHLVIIPEHLEHAPAHGLFFLIVGILQIVWGVLVWRKPSTELYYIGVVMAGWLIALYALTRVFPAPFGHGPESVQVIDIICKVCEGLGMFTLATLIFQGILINSNRKAAWRTMAWIVLLSLIVAGTTYSAAIAAEPIFPGLSIPSEEHHEHEESEDHHEEATPPAEHDH
jgi:uncharacterized membrane protein HdeD (DUF308 family)